MKKLLINLIKKYQKNISADTAPSCRFTPTCSEYAINSIKKYGVLIGLIKAIKRIIICNFLGPSGYDPE